MGVSVKAGKENQLQSDNASEMQIRARNKFGLVIHIGGSKDCIGMLPKSEFKRRDYHLGSWHANAAVDRNRQNLWL